MYVTNAHNLKRWPLSTIADRGSNGWLDFRRRRYR